MPSKNTGNAAPLTASGVNGLLPFVSCELSPEDKASCKANLLKPESLVNAIHELASGGYRVSFAWDARSDCMSVICSGTGAQCPNKGYALSARGPDLVSAFTVLCYKHFTMLGEAWPVSGSVGKRDVWG